MDNPYAPPDWLNNYSLHVKKDDSHKISEDRYMPFREININLRIYCDTQHDGRLLTKEEVSLNEYNLSGIIISKITKEVADFVKEANAFAIQGYKL